MLALVDENGSVVERYSYSAYGEPTIFDSAGNPLGESAYGNRYLFQGREYDFQTHLYYFRARWYSPETGRWLSKDPIGISGGLNLYAFCANNPVNFIDPLGLAWRQERPLDIPGLRGTTAGPMHHDRFLYKDGSDSGFYGDSTVRSDDASQSLQGKYRNTGSFLDDVVLREAERRIAPQWDQKINPNNPTYDLDGRQCQDYCDAVLREYYRMLNVNMQDPQKDDEC